MMIKMCVCGAKDESGLWVVLPSSTRLLDQDAVRPCQGLSLAGAEVCGHGV